MELTRGMGRPVPGDSWAGMVPVLDLEGLNMREYENLKDVPGYSNVKETEFATYVGIKPDGTQTPAFTHPEIALAALYTSNSQDTLASDTLAPDTLLP